MVQMNFAIVAAPAVIVHEKLPPPPPPPPIQYNIYPYINLYNKHIYYITNKKPYPKDIGSACQFLLYLSKYVHINKTRSVRYERICA